MATKDDYYSGITVVDGDRLDDGYFNNLASCIVPVGGLVPVLKNITGVPTPPTSHFMLADGSTVSDANSPINGQTVPDLNGDNRFIRGVDTAGGEGGQETIALNHNHSVSLAGASYDGGGLSGVTSTDLSNVMNKSELSATQDILPKYHNAVWYIRFK